MSDLIHQDGKWYKPITSEYAFSVRKDVQLYWRGSLSYRIQKEETPEYFREPKANTLSSSWWRGWQRYILVDDPSKEEYECATDTR